jgi:O-methyltransferase
MRASSTPIMPTNRQRAPRPARLRTRLPEPPTNFSSRHSSMSELDASPQTKPSSMRSPAALRSCQKPGTLLVINGSHVVTLRQCVCLRKTYIMAPKEGSFSDFALQHLKRVAFRWPGLRELSRPRYPYNIEPLQLSWLCEAIEKTKTNPTRTASPGCIVEVGVARGMTTVFLLEHMKNIGDLRIYVCIDTFSGFVDEDVEYEVKMRGKIRNHYRGWGWNQRDIFDNNIDKCGFRNIRVIQADARTFDWSSIPPIDVMLLDVDLYLPTKAVLEHSYSRWSPHARVMLDDCAEGGNYDGAHQAYIEFCAAKGWRTLIVGNKGGIIIKQD